MSWGGARPGAGRPKKSVSEKVLEGNPGKREITVIKFAGDKSSPGKSSSNSSSTQNSSIQVNRPPAFLDQNGKEGDNNLPSAAEIYKMLYEFISGSGCGELIAPNLIEDFAHFRRAYLECEYINRTMGRIAAGKRSPYVAMAIEYSKQAMSIFDRIWNIISQNSEQPLEGKNDFLMLLQNRGF